MRVLFVAVAAAVGLVKGCYLNTLEYRLRSPRKILTRDCFCPDCGDVIPLWAQIPVVGYLLLGGRCRHCRAPISPRYPLVETGCMLIYLVAAALTGAATPTILLGLAAETAYIVLSLTLRGAMQASRPFVRKLLGGFGSLLWLSLLGLMALGILSLAAGGN